jgi:hypothetical protein
MNIPIYEAIIENEADGLSCISFVENPAMESNMLVFSEDKPTKQLFQENYKRCITGVVIRADHPVYRFDEYYGEYYITFSKETIRELTEKYSKEKLLNNVSIHHNGKLIDDVVMLEFFIKDIEKGINPKQFTDIEDGSLFCTFKINNEELWEEILKGNFGGLSMELFIGLEQSYEQTEPTEPDMFEYLFSISDKEFEDILKLEQKVDIELEDNTLSDVQLYQLGKDNDGKIIIYFNPETNEYGKLKYKEVVNIIPKGTPLVPFPKFKLPENIIVTKTKDNPTIIDILNKPQYVVISYNDEKPGAATGYRTCFIGALGYTTRGNECIRVYEYNGDSRQGFKDGRWRLLLTKRILDLKAVDYMEGIVTAPPQFNHNGDNGMSRVIKVAKI